MFEAEWSSFIDADMTRLRSMARPVALLRLAAAGGFRRLDRFVASSLTDERLIKAHTFQALYVGLPPGRRLAIYAVVAHMDTVGGVYFPVTGGMHAIPRALATVAEKAGGVFRYGVRAERVETDASGVAAVRLDGGERVAAGEVVVACDLRGRPRGAAARGGGRLAAAASALLAVLPGRALRARPSAARSGAPHAALRAGVGGRLLRAGRRAAAAGPEPDGHLRSDASAEARDAERPGTRPEPGERRRLGAARARDWSGGCSGGSPVSGTATWRARRG